MRNKLIYISLLISYTSIYAQQNKESLMSLVQSERDFSAMCKSEGLGKSFGHFFDPTVVYFSQGNQVNFSEFQAKQREKNPGPEKFMMHWEPIYADISSSNDFGYTTGPVYFYGDKADEKPAGYMYYSSVWKKNAEGQWRVLMDLGIRIPGSPQENLEFKTSAKPFNKKTKPGKTDALQDMTKQELKYCKVLNASAQSFKKEFLSAEIRLHRLNKYPFVGIDAAQKVDEQDNKHAYEYLGGQMASSGDLGFTYGKVKIAGVKDGKSTETNAIYYRVWKKENGKEWKVVLDVIGIAG